MRLDPTKSATPNHAARVDPGKFIVSSGLANHMID